ncbi:MAG: metallophosphoesterase [Chitinophagaceae bacterium]
MFKALDKLYKDINAQPCKRGPVLSFQQDTGKFIVFSDQHKGARDGADDFTLAEPNYLAALDYYNTNDFYLVCLGDNEELWENSLGKVKEYNHRTFEAEKKFVMRKAFAKVIGNHDLYWGNDPFAWWQLKKIYEADVSIYEGIVLSTTIGAAPLNIFCTHGHQGDAQSDGNWFSKFFVARIWGPLQAYLRINPNTPSNNNEKKTLHNEIMYEWSSAQLNTLLITGHTHQPVFESLTHLEQLEKQLQEAQSTHDNVAISSLETEIRKIEKDFTAIAVDFLTMKPTYFNSGCCCFSDGDITGIEIADGCMRLIKWTMIEQVPQRQVLEETKFTELIKKL